MALFGAHIGCGLEDGEEEEEEEEEARAACSFRPGLRTFPPGVVGFAAVAVPPGVGGMDLADFRRRGSSVMVYVEGDSRNVAYACAASSGKEKRPR